MPGEGRVALVGLGWGARDRLQQQISAPGAARGEDAFRLPPALPPPPPPSPPPPPLALIQQPALAPLVSQLYRFALMGGKKVAVEQAHAGVVSEMEGSSWT